MSPARPARSCVIVVENLPVPFDRRVWQEAQALHRAGWIVSVICPTNTDFPKAFEVIDDIAIYRHPLPAEGRGALAYLREYSTALFHEFRALDLARVKASLTTPIIIDLRNIYPIETMKAHGFRYVCVGRGFGGEG